MTTRATAKNENQISGADKLLREEFLRQSDVNPSQRVCSW